MISAKTHNGFIRATFRMTVLSMERAFIFFRHTTSCSFKVCLRKKKKKTKHIFNVCVWSESQTCFVCMCVQLDVLARLSDSRGKHTHTKKPRHSPAGSSRPIWFSEILRFLYAAALMPPRYKVCICHLMSSQKNKRHWSGHDLRWQARLCSEWCVTCVSWEC